MPYCHQGIVFKMPCMPFNEKYKISSDYDFVLKNLPDISLLKISDINGYVYYDNQGISSIEKKDRDRENFEIIKGYFGYLCAVKYYIMSIFRRYFAKIISLLK